MPINNEYIQNERDHLGRVLSDSIFMGPTYGLSSKDSEPNRYLKGVDFARYAELKQYVMGSNLFSHFDKGLSIKIPITKLDELFRMAWKNTIVAKGEAGQKDLWILLANSKHYLKRTEFGRNKEYIPGVLQAGIERVRILQGLPKEVKLDEDGVVNFLSKPEARELLWQATIYDQLQNLIINRDDRFIAPKYEIYWNKDFLKLDTENWSNPTTSKLYEEEWMVQIHNVLTSGALITKRGREWLDKFDPEYLEPEPELVGISEQTRNIIFGPRVAENRDVFNSQAANLVEIVSKTSEPLPEIEREIKYPSQIESDYDKHAAKIVKKPLDGGGYDRPRFYQEL